MSVKLDYPRTPNSSFEPRKLSFSIVEEKNNEEFSLEERISDITENAFQIPTSKITNPKNEESPVIQPLNISSLLNNNNLPISLSEESKDRSPSPFIIHSKISKNYPISLPFRPKRLFDTNTTEEKTGSPKHPRIDKPFQGLGTYERAIQQIHYNPMDNTYSITLYNQEIPLTYLGRGCYKKAFSFLDPATKETRVLKVYLSKDELNSDPKKSPRRFSETACLVRTEKAMSQYHKIRDILGLPCATIYNDPETDGFFITDYIAGNAMTQTSLDQVSRFFNKAYNHCVDLDLGPDNLRIDPKPQNLAKYLKAEFVEHYKEKSPNYEKCGIVVNIDYREDDETDEGDCSLDQSRNNVRVSLLSVLPDWKAKLNSEDYQYLRSKIIPEILK